jgi:predicted component of type VI protein secretion system
MAYLTFIVKGRELGRRQLEGPLVIGRSPDCDVCVHDILLSRYHCEFKAEGSNWIVTDLSSKNGIYRGETGIKRLLLRDGDEIRIGKTTVTFCTGKFAPKPRKGEDEEPVKRRRPADPWAAMNETLSGFDYVQAKLEEKQKQDAATTPTGKIPHHFSRMPKPQPAPKDPMSYANDDVYALLTELASSSWDSIYMNASRPAPPTSVPRPPLLRRPRNPVSDGRGSARNARSTKNENRRRDRRSRWKRLVRSALRGFAAIGQTVMVLGLFHLIGKV